MRACTVHTATPPLRSRSPARVSARSSRHYHHGTKSTTTSKGRWVLALWHPCRAGAGPCGMRLRGADAALRSQIARPSRCTDPHSSTAAVRSSSSSKAQQ